MPQEIFDIKPFGIDLTFGFWHLTSKANYIKGIPVNGP